MLGLASPPCPTPCPEQNPHSGQDLCLFPLSLPQYLIGLRDGNRLLLSISRRWIFFFFFLRLKLCACFAGSFPPPGRLTGFQVGLCRHRPAEGSLAALGPCCTTSSRLNLFPLQLDDGKGSFSRYVFNDIVLLLRGRWEILGSEARLLIRGRSRLGPVSLRRWAAKGVGCVRQEIEGLRVEQLEFVV